MSPQAPEEPHTDELASSLVDEVAEDDELVSPQTFGGGPVELSLMPLYPDHIDRHIWDGEVKLVGLILFKLRLLVYYKFLTLIYFSAGPWSAGVY